MYCSEVSAVPNYSRVASLMNGCHRNLCRKWEWDILLGLAALAPHLWRKWKNVYIFIILLFSLFIYIYGTCVFRVYVHPAPFLRDAIFPHCMLVHVTTAAQEPD